MSINSPEIVVVTGGLGFIGSAVVRYLIENTEKNVVNIDALTYAGNLETLSEVSKSSRYHFEHADIRDKHHIIQLFEKYQPSCVIHLAAESHVDRSIDGPEVFIDTNIKGTFNLLEAFRFCWDSLSEERREGLRFLHVSTDEVFGSLGAEGFFSESSNYKPNSPYSASKAAADHLVRAWGETYGLPIMVTNCSNNYGPYHYPEKLIPLVILNALESKALPVYGNGEQIRDWLFVEDHAQALYKVMSEGKVGETYNIGGHNEKKNIEVVRKVCELLDELAPQYRSEINSYSELITFVADRPGHDERYAIDASKMEKELGWIPQETFETGLRNTVRWYLSNLDWCKSVQERSARARKGLL